MLCPSCGTSSDREGARFCRVCGKPLYAPQASHFVEVSHEDAGRLRQLDLCFVMDATGSMGSYIEATRKELEHFARTLSSHDIHPDACYGLVLYRDHIGSARDVVTQRYPFTANLQDLQDFLEGTHARGGGGDGPEAVADGLYDGCYVMPWRENSHKVMVLVGDAPPHGVGGRRDNYPEGCPCGRDPLAISRYARARGIVVFSLGIGDNRWMRESFEQIARHGGGKFVTISGADTLIDEILLLLQPEFDKVSIDLRVFSAYRPDSTPQSIAATTGLDVGEVDESMNRLRQKKMIR
jgi:hypothetical protein